MRVQKQMFAGEFGGAFDWADLLCRRGGRSRGGDRVKIFIAEVDEVSIYQGKMGFVKWRGALYNMLNGWI